MKELPSPEQLRNKIIIKAKKFTHSGPSKAPSIDNLNEKNEQPVDEKNRIDSPKPERKVSQASLVCHFDVAIGLDFLTRLCSSFQSLQPVAKPLFDMVNICEAVKFQSFAQSRKNGNHFLFLPHFYDWNYI